MNNFLSIVWYKVLPAEYGGQKGIAHFNEHLGNRVSLTCLCSRNNSNDEKHSYEVINDLPVSKLQFWNPFVRRRILSLIRNGRFTHIIIEHPWHGWLGKYKERLGFKFIVHAHNIEYLRMRSRQKLFWSLLKKTESNAFKAADLILFKTAADKQTAITSFNISASKCMVLPFGITESAQPASMPSAREQIRMKYELAPSEKLILFAGSLDYEPNNHALEIIARQVVPILQKRDFPFKLIICGALNDGQKKVLNGVNGLISPGFVPSISDHYLSADVFINPVLTGSGVQTKSIEAIANGCNVVSTEFAARGLPSYLNGKKLFVSTDGDWESFAINIIRASSNIEKTPPVFYQDYNWQNIIENMLQCL